MTIKFADVKDGDHIRVSLILEGAAVVNDAEFGRYVELGEWSFGVEDEDDDGAYTVERVDPPLPTVFPSAIRRKSDDRVYGLGHDGPYYHHADGAALHVAVLDPADFTVLFDAGKTP